MKQRTELSDSYEIPVYAVCDLEYGDLSGCLTDEDTRHIKAFEEKISKMCPDGYILDWDTESLDSPSFSRYPEFGLPTDCVKLNVYKLIIEK